VFDETGFTAARRPLQHHGQTRRVRRLKQFDLARDRNVKRLFRDSVFFDGSFGHDDICEEYRCFPDTPSPSLASLAAG
jgi:hypothetical protein